MACGLLVDPARLPLASSSRLPTAPAFLLFDCFGNSVPPKEPPSLRCKAPPPKCLATVVSEPDPHCFFYPFAFVDGSISNECANTLVQVPGKPNFVTALIKLGGKNRKDLIEAFPGMLEAKATCRRSIQIDCNYELKSLAGVDRTACCSKRVSRARRARSQVRASGRLTIAQRFLSLGSKDYFCEVRETDG